MPFDALSFLREYRIPYWTEGPNTQRGWVNIRCPFCSDSSNHGGFNLYSDYYNCWKCGRKRLEKVIQSLLGVNWTRAEEIIQNHSDRLILTRNLKRKKDKPKSIELPGGPLEKRHKRYLKSRGFDPDYLEGKYKLQGTGPVGIWKFRIIIPIYFNHKLVSFQGRDITGLNKDERYKTLSVDESIMDPKSILYGWDFCSSRDIGVVVEGAPSVWNMGDGVMATLGTSMTEYQVKLLCLFQKIFFLFDSEKEAQERAHKYASHLAAMGKDVEIIDFEKDYDPGDYSAEEVKYIRKEIGI